jgi:adenylate cyclase
MGIKDDVRAGVAEIVGTPFKTRDGHAVPSAETIGFSEAVKLDATYLYADLVDSSFAAHRLDKMTAGKVMRAYLDASTRILRHYGGEIRSFDGDRVMAIFIGGRKNNEAVRAALALNWAVEKEVRPQLEAKFPSVKEKTQVREVIGIATGEALLINGGVRGNNDMVSIGPAPNVAAKLSSVRLGSKSIYLTDDVYSFLEGAQKVSASGTNMWTKMDNQIIGGTNYAVYGSGYLLAP